MVLDLIHTLSTLANLRERIETVNRTMAELHRMQETYRWFDPADLAGSAERLRAICREEPENGEAAHLLARLEQVLNGRAACCASCVPSRRSVRSACRSMSRRSADSGRRLAAPPGDPAGPLGTDRRLVAGEAGGHPDGLSGISFQKLVWVFIVGCLAGYIVETIYCLVTRGVIESRQGMVYGPFNQVYGSARC